MVFFLLLWDSNQCPLGCKPKTLPVEPPGHPHTHTHTHTTHTHTKQKAIPNTHCNIIQFSYLVPMQGPQLAVNETFTVQITSKSDFIYLSAHLLLSSSQLPL